MENLAPLPPDLAELYAIWEAASAPLQNAVSDQSQQDSEPVQQQEREKATKLTGRLAATPRFDIRPDRIRVNFTLAQHLDDGTTVFHQMYSTKTYAERLKGKNLGKGDLVEATGVWQRHIVGKKKDGQLDERRVFYCYGARVR